MCRERGTAPLASRATFRQLHEKVMDGYVGINREKTNFSEPSAPVDHEEVLVRAGRQRVRRAVAHLPLGLILPHTLICKLVELPVKSHLIFRQREALLRRGLNQKAKQKQKHRARHTSQVSLSPKPAPITPISAIEALLRRGLKES